MADSGRSFFSTLIFCFMAFSACCLVAGIVPAQENEAGENLSEVQGIFRGELDVSIINLYVSVVDKDGRAVPGLGPEDFEIIENGEKMEITNFAILDHGKRVVPETVESETQETAAEGLANEVSPRHVALLFDLPSLQIRNKRRVVEAVESLVRDGLADGDQFLVAVNSGELEIVSEFSSYEASLMAALQGVAELKDSGDAVKRSKRMLKRTIHTTRFVKMTMVPFSSDVAIDEGYIQAQAGMLQTEINNRRQLEYQRIDQSIGVTDELVRALAGIDGPKVILWIGEDLAIRPAYDLYQVFYKKAAFYQDILRISHPELWAREMELSRQFQHLAASAQGCGATFHVIDASDRDREMGSADFGSPGLEDLINSEAVGSLWTPGTDLSEIWDLTEGADYMALATGGSVQKNTRDLEDRSPGFGN